MKIFYILFLTVFLVSGCGGSSSDTSTPIFLEVDDTGNTQFNNTNLEATLLNYPLGTLNQDEIDGLNLMREEEKLARDVYQALYNLHGLNIFNNISQSESTHTLAMKILLDRYSLPDPVAGLVDGEFATNNMQVLYTNLVTSGTPELIDALKVGVLIEELDIYDLERLKQELIENDDILLVYNNLQKGSRNHLRSFYSRLLDAGGDYVPVYLSQEEFNQIISSAIESGR